MKHQVLVVDDDRAIQMLMADILTRAGYEISTAKDGRDALKHFELRKPDLIITDLKMPFVDGYELCLTIRESSSVPILVVTGWAGSEEKCKACEAGANACMRKPYELKKFLAQVEALLRGDLTHPAY